MTMTAVPVELSGLPLRQQRARLNGDDPLDHELDGPTCQVCGNEIDADRAAKGARTCGSEPCVREHRARRRRGQRDGVTATPAALNGVSTGNGTSHPLDPPAGRTEPLSPVIKVDVVAFAEAIFNAYGPRTELELTTPTLTVVFHARGGRP
jgi:hypothetical protein